MNEQEREFPAAARVVDESVIVNAVRRATLSASRNSAVLRAAAAWTSQGRRPATLKGSPYLVLMAIAGCATHAVLLRFMPDRIAPVRPMAYGMVVAFALFVTIAGFITTRSSTTATADSSAGTANATKSC